MNIRLALIRVSMALLPSLPIDAGANGINPPQLRTVQNVQAKCLSRLKGADISLLRTSVPGGNLGDLSWKSRGAEKLLPLRSLTQIAFSGRKPKGDFSRAKLTFSDGAVREGEVRVAEDGQPVVIQGYGEQDGRLASFSIAGCVKIEFITSSDQEVRPRSVQKS